MRSLVVFLANKRLRLPSDFKQIINKPKNKPQLLGTDALVLRLI